MDMNRAQAGSQIRRTAAALTMEEAVKSGWRHCCSNLNQNIVKPLPSAVGNARHAICAWFAAIRGCCCSSAGHARHCGKEDCPQLPQTLMKP